MTTQDTVEQVIKSFIDSETLFTALDISNKVKETLPYVRHKEVRAIVRAAFTTQIEPAGWSQTNIQVTLVDGSRQTARLYHPISSSWDLDTLYDDQKRSQTSVKAPYSRLSSFVSSVQAVSPPSNIQVSMVPTNVPATPQAVAHTDLWRSKFQSQPSLFPRRS
jgi:hypothetical protein